MDIAHVGIILGDFSQLEIVRGEQTVTIRDRSNNMFQNAPGQPQTIISTANSINSPIRRSASTELIDDNQTVCMRIIVRAFRMFDMSIISFMKVDTPRDWLSDAPIRV